MYFGGINGFNAFYPERINPNSFIPAIRFVSLRLLNKKTNQSDANSTQNTALFEKNEIKLKHNQNSFTVSFAALSYQAPKKTAMHINLKVWTTTGFTPKKATTVSLSTICLQENMCYM